MISRVDNINTKYNQQHKVSFKGPLDGAVTQALTLVDTNPMVNAAVIDVGSMVIPRTYVDTKKRNKFAGFETFFREFTGTIIMCFTAGPVALLMGKAFNKAVDKDINISSKNWATNKTFDVLKKAYEGNENNTKKYVSNVLDNLSGVNGKGVSKWKDISWDRVEWNDHPDWKNFKWQDRSWADLVDNSKSEKQIVDAFARVISDKNAHPKDVKQVLNVIEHRIVNALKVGSSVDVAIGKDSVNSSVKNLVRDTHELGKNIFYAGVDVVRAEAKLKNMNKFKSLSAVGIVAMVGLTNQYVNRLITKKRTGQDGFVGNTDYSANKQQAPKNAQKTDEKPQKDKWLLPLKILSSVGLAAMSAKVMNIKKPAEFLQRLEFTGPVTSGNVIKTLYTATLIGRFMASRNRDELRESSTRDYLGFLNWLVFGGFVAKGVAQAAFDRGQNTLFNVTEDGSKGAKKWLNNVSLKSHEEIAAMGGEFVKKNLRNRNIAQTSGLLYSGVALGVLIPLINIFVTKKLQNKGTENKDTNKIYNFAPAQKSKEVFSVFEQK